jgi:hypothetical protein
VTWHVHELGRFYPAAFSSSSILHKPRLDARSPGGVSTTYPAYHSVMKLLLYADRSPPARYEATPCVPLCCSAAQQVKLRVRQASNRLTLCVRLGLGDIEGWQECRPLFGGTLSGGTTAAARRRIQASSACTLASPTLNPCTHSGEASCTCKHLRQHLHKRCPAVPHVRHASRISWLSTMILRHLLPTPPMQPHMG